MLYLPRPIGAQHAGRTNDISRLPMQHDDRDVSEQIASRYQDALRLKKFKFVSQLLQNRWTYVF